MTTEDQRLSDDKMRAEIAKLLAETKQISVGTFAIPFVTAAGLMGATAALVKLFILGGGVINASTYPNIS